MVSVTRRAGRKEKPAKASVEDQLLAAVERLVGDGHSFTALSIEQLAREAGVSRATFYLHFNDKSDLVVRLMERVRHEVLDSIGVWYMSAENVSDDEVLDANMKMLRVLKRHHAILTAVGETSIYDPQVRQLLDNLLDEISAASVITLESVRKAGKAHPDVSGMAIQIMTWMVYHGGMHFLKGADEVKLKKIAEAMSHITRRAIFTGD